MNHDADGHFAPKQPAPFEKKLQVKSENGIKMRIRVKTLTGQTTTLEMNSSDSVNAIKNKIFDVLGIPSKQIQ